MRTVLVVAAALIALPACPSASSEPRPTPKPSKPAHAAAQPEAPKRPAVQLTTQKTWVNGIRSEKDWMRLSRKVGSERFVKAVIDIQTGVVYYFDVNVFDEHREFAFREFYTEALTPARRMAFNRNYGKDKPDFMLVTAVNHLDPDIWTFSFWAGDQMTAQHVQRAYERLSETFFMAPKLRFRPASPRQERLAKSELPNVPSITSDSLYKLSERHTFNIGRRVGVLRIVKKGADYDKLVFQPHEIVILSEPIPEITAVSGIISEQFSTPLAHVNLRAAAWGIPHIGLRGASKKYKALAGKPVFFEAREDGFTLRAATKEEAQLIDREGHGNEKVAIPPADLKEKALKSLEDMQASEADAYGAKAANLGEIAHAKLSGVNVPAGFGIPIAYYDAHMKRAGLDKRVAELLKDPKLRKDGAYRKEQLAKLREAIETAPVDEGLLDAVMGGVKAMRLPEGKGVFVRSSTNAEDLPGFTGAGLYTTVPNVIGREAVADAIRKVWASVWNFRAFEEREYHGIDHTAVYGAILVQVGVDANAAGVLITTNIYDSRDRDTYTINAKSGLGMRVVGGKKIPEQLLYSRDEQTIKVLSRSDEATMLVFDDKGGVKEVPTPPGQPVLSDARVVELGEASARIEKLFPQARALDIEWLFEGTTLWIVQARPFVTR